MSEENLKDFVVNWSITGLLCFCLLTFAITFMFYNNPIGLNDGTQDVFSTTNSNMSSSLYSLESRSDNVLNITANTNPETSYLGSRDSVATAYDTYSSSSSFWTQSKLLIGYVFTGDSGKILITTLGGLIGFIGVYLIIRLVRQG